jgi:hypothetical protein
MVPLKSRSNSNSKYEIDFEKKTTRVSKNGGYGCTAVIVSEKPPAKNLWLRCRSSSCPQAERTADPWWQLSDIPLQSAGSLIKYPG